jgi:hypothetical protein
MLKLKSQHLFNILSGVLNLHLHLGITKALLHFS